jgi:hypothetical protein
MSMGISGSQTCLRASKTAFSVRATLTFLKDTSEQEMCQQGAWAKVAPMQKFLEKEKGDFLKIGKKC